jgi:hypothetical protein
LRLDPIWAELRSSPAFGAIVEQAAQPIIATEPASKQ